MLLDRILQLAKEQQQQSAIFCHPVAGINFDTENSI